MEKKNNDPIVSPVGNPVCDVRSPKNNDGILREKIDADELKVVTGGNADGGCYGSGDGICEMVKEDFGCFGNGTADVGG